MGRDDEPEKIFMVYRPAEELSSPETIASFKLLPWVDEHEMLGSKAQGKTPAEKKGIHGVIGEDVFFEDDTLYGNVKVFSEQMAFQINQGKEGLSLGYGCEYDFTPGIYQGQPYDVVQRKQRGNHLALVDEGRMGNSVRVLDHALTFDHMEIIDMAKKISGLDEEEKQAEKTEDENEEEKTSMDARMGALESGMSQVMDSISGLAKRLGMDEDEEKKASEDEEEEEEGKDEEEESEDEDEDKEKSGQDSIQSLKKKLAAMDAKISGLTKGASSVKKSVMQEIAKAGELASRVSPHTGAFDHSEMEVKDVAKYACDKLEIPCTPGTEIDALNGFLTATASTKGPIFSMDSRQNVETGETPSSFNKFISH